MITTIAAARKDACEAFSPGEGEVHPAMVSKDDVPSAPSVNDVLTSSGDDDIVA